LFSGKGTSARDGSSLAGALLEYLDNQSVYGIFATHLHELFLLPLTFRNVINKKMGYSELVSPDEKEGVQWTYQLEDGQCKDSMALTTAKQYGINKEILNRAQSLMNVFDDICRPSTSTSPSSASSSFSSGTLDDSNFEDDRVDAATSRFDVELEEVPASESRSDSLPTVIRSHHDNRKHYLQQTIQPLVQQFYHQIINCSDTSVVKNDRQFVFIPSEHNPPPLLEDQSVVYILHIYSGKRRKDVSFLVVCDLSLFSSSFFFVVFSWCYLCW
jgi:hypothetical protein